MYTKKMFLKLFLICLLVSLLFLVCSKFDSEYPTSNIDTKTQENSAEILSVDEGCGTGFWKNHPDSWIPTGYSTDQMVASVFGAAVSYPEISSSTLMSSLSFKVRRGIEGGARNLVRKAVTAVLNAAHPDVNYPLTVSSIVSDVNAALASVDRGAMMSVAMVLESYNDLECPLEVIDEGVIELEKKTNGEDADNAPGPVISVGDAVLWEYMVSNSGEVALTDVTVTDSDPTLVVSCPLTELAPGESMVCTATGFAVAGQYSNQGIASGILPNGTVVIDSNMSHYFGQSSPPSGAEGCGSGFWKNHPDSWSPTGYSTNQLVTSVFVAAASYPEIASASMITALSFKGGKGIEGGARNLVRKAVTAVLNAAHPDVNYPLTVPSIVSDVNAALASGNRGAMMSVATVLENYNDQECPLDL
jgi:uncharacterized repeat protein (TIGR01451 family)